MTIEYDYREVLEYLKGEITLEELEYSEEEWGRFTKTQQELKISNYLMSDRESYFEVEL